MIVGIQGKKKNGLHVPLAIVSTTMCASEVDVKNKSPFHERSKHDPLKVLWAITLVRLNFRGVLNPESSTHLLLIFPKLTSKMAAEAEF